MNSKEFPSHSSLYPPVQFPASLNVLTRRTELLFKTSKQPNSLSSGQDAPAVLRKLLVGEQGVFGRDRSMTTAVWSAGSTFLRFKVSFAVLVACPENNGGSNSPLKFCICIVFTRQWIFQQQNRNLQFTCLQKKAQIHCTSVCTSSYCCCSIEGGTHALTHTESTCW